MLMMTNLSKTTNYIENDNKNVENDKIRSCSTIFDLISPIFDLIPIPIRNLCQNLNQIVATIKSKG